MRALATNAFGTPLDDVTSYDEFLGLVAAVSVDDVAIQRVEQAEMETLFGARAALPNQFLLPLAFGFRLFVCLFVWWEIIVPRPCVAFALPLQEGRQWLARLEDDMQGVLGSTSTFRRRLLRSSFIHVASSSRGRRGSTTASLNFGGTSFPPTTAAATDSFAHAGGACDAWLTGL